MLDALALMQVKAYFAAHPVLRWYGPRVCIALTGSYAFRLGGKGADIDVKVLCPSDVYQAIRSGLIAAGRIGRDDEPEEEFPDLTGDYSLELLPAIWERVRAHDDMTALFVYGNLVYLTGDEALLSPLVQHCRSIPAAVLKRQAEQERATMGQGLYAFLRSFQTEDPVARMLARATMVRTGLRLAFLAESMAPPYDKHLFRLTDRLAQGSRVADLVQQFLGAGEPSEPSEAGYEAVAAAADWHAMYAAAAGTPAVRFRDEVLKLLDQE